MCLAATLPPPPELGGGISLDPPSLGSVGGDVDICCKRLAFSVPLPPLPLPPFAVNGAVTAVIAAAFKTAQEYIDKLPKDCPLE